ncbi:MAG: H-X9-DG-CTERM domain-containing protein [Chthoniobacteraceae bacterium]
MTIPLVQTTGDPWIGKFARQRTAAEKPMRSNDLIARKDVKAGHRTVFEARPATPANSKQQTNRKNSTMKTKTSKHPKQTKSTVQLKDMKPKKNPKGGIALLVPAVQKVREAASRSGGVNVGLGDGSVRN